MFAATELLLFDCTTILQHPSATVVLLLLLPLLPYMVAPAAIMVCVCLAARLHPAAPGSGQQYN